MESSGALLGPGSQLFLILYLIGLIGIGFAGRAARRDGSLGEFYLGGRDLGPFVLFLTLYATQYSGLTFIGLVGKAYRQGFSFLVSVTFTMSIVGAYFIFAPRLYRLSKRRRYVTFGDFVEDRFGSAGLAGLVTAVSIFALASYILTNLKAAGYIVDAVTGGAVSSVEGIVYLSLLMLVYETLGGMRAVAWTDVLQGLLLLAGCLGLFVAVTIHYGTPTDIGELLLAQRPELWNPPSTLDKTSWLSTLLLVAVAVSIYPHAIQRIYAARDERALRFSFQLMVLMPLFTMLPLIAVGFVGAAHFPDLDVASSERVLLVVLEDLRDHVPLFSAFLVVLVCAIIAAIMSTVDSALLSISSLFTQDVYRRIAPVSSTERLTSIGKLSSWVVMAFVAFLATNLPRTLWRLTEVKLEVLCQAAPALYFGLFARRRSGRACSAGLIVGLAVTLATFLAPSGSVLAGRPFGLHGGIWGLAFNVAVVFLLTSGRRRAHGEGEARGSNRGS